MNQTPKPKHTPGPWSVAGRVTGFADYNPDRHIYSSFDRAHLGTGCIASVHSSDANAQLIACAPELLALCKDALLRDDIADSELGDAFRAAIAKAEGWDI